jgi:hypothetical protein
MTKVTSLPTTYQFTPPSRTEPCTCLMGTLVGIRSSQCPVCTLFCDTTSADAALGWCLFVAAMTPNRTLRSDLIRSVHDRASLYGRQSIAAVPLIGPAEFTVDATTSHNYRLGR